MLALASRSHARRLVLLLLAFLIGSAIARTPLQAQVHTNCVSCPTLTITPDGGSASQPQNGTYTIKFVAKNTGSATGTWHFACSATGGASCASDDVTPSSDDFSPGQIDTLTATYTLGVTSGTVTVTATGSTNGETGSYNVTVIGVPPSISLVVPTLTGGSRALVHNRQPVIRALITPVSGAPVDTTTISLAWRNTTPQSTARFSRGVIEWEVDSASRLSIADSGLITVKACASGNQCTTVTRYAVLVNDSTPIIGLTGVPLEAVGAGFSAPFGPGLSLSGAEVETGFATVPYFSWGRAQSTGLVYSTRQSYPRALVPVNIELPWPSGTPTSVKVVLKDGSVRLDSLLVSSPTCTTWSVKLCRVVLQGDFSGSSYSIPTRKWLTVEASVTSGATVKTSTDSVEAVLVDRRTTRYGSGWWPSAFLQLVGSGADRILIGSNGAATIYRGSGDSVYAAPPANFTILTKVSGGWELRARGSSAKVVFDGNGRLAASVGANGDTTRLVYNASTDELDSIIDPTKHTLSFAYSSGKLTTIASLSGGAQRPAAITIDGNNQLTRDSVSATSITSYTYVSYPGTGTRVLAKRIGLVLDTTIVTYDSTFFRRPSQVRLPLVQDEANAWVTPTVAYTAYERQGFGALRSLDSLYVELKDPRSNWTRALVNRWGQILKSWDSLGTISRASYDGDGLLLWQEGKVADSSRTYFVYDALRRPVKSYIYQSATQTLRGDSLVYDVNHRVAKRIDNRGIRADTVSYDAAGNNIWEKDAAGNITQRWFHAGTGQLDSLRLAGNSVSQLYRYDTIWSNLRQVVNEAGTATTNRLFDSYGRTVTDSSQVQIQQPQDTASRWAWAKQDTYYGLANQVDSVHAAQSSVQASKTGSFTWLTDSVHTKWVRYLFDAAGRDTALVHDWTVQTRYAYDRLGRLRARLLWADSTAVVDSLFYDIAGNAKKSIDRMGRTITTDFDSRNRDTASVIPGVGTVRKAYVGPLDQLTREWIASPVDSIGNVNGELRWGYDQHGRLKADTGYTGSTARVTTHSYDRYERDSTFSDPLGTWSIRYDATRGVVDSLIAPWSDTVSYAYDAQWRVVGPAVRSGSTIAATQVTPYWAPNGDLDSLVHKVGSTARGKYAKRGTDGDSPGLISTWVDPNSQTWQDSVVYDGWLRATVHVLMEGGVAVTRDSMWFDRNGNVRTSATAGVNESYDLVTNRLTSQVVGGVTWTLKYDRAGNLILRKAGSDSTRYFYDGLNRLRTVRRGAPSHADSVIARYDYDVAGRRIVKRVYSAATGGTVGFTRFVYRGNGVAFETDSGGTLGQRYLWGMGTDALVALRTASGTEYYAVLDKLGSVRGMVLRDASGTVKLAFTYGTYGTIVDSAGAGLAAGVSLRYRWTGREYDAETGFYYLRARYFSQSQKRFIQEDPLGFGGSSNLYEYAQSGPLEGTDPSGMMTDWRKYNQDMAAQSAALAVLNEGVHGAAFDTQSYADEDWNNQLSYSSDLLDALQDQANKVVTADANGDCGSKQVCTVAGGGSTGYAGTSASSLADVGNANAPEPQMIGYGLLPRKQLSNNPLNASFPDHLMIDDWGMARHEGPFSMEMHLVKKGRLAEAYVYNGTITMEMNGQMVSWEATVWVYRKNTTADNMVHWMAYFWYPKQSTP